MAKSGQTPIMVHFAFDQILFWFIAISPVSSVRTVILDYSQIFVAEQQVSNRTL